MRSHFELSKKMDNFFGVQALIRLGQAKFDSVRKYLIGQEIVKNNHS
jgi:hypothetical protein